MTAAIAAPVPATTRVPLPVDENPRDGMNGLPGARGLHNRDNRTVELTDYAMSRSAERELSAVPNTATSVTPKYTQREGVSQCHLYRPLPALVPAGVT